MSQPSMRVAVGVILRKSSSDESMEVCISLRPKHLHKGGLWEFPGGKIEEGETVEEALYRELQEELGIQIKETRPLMQISWEYAEKTVLLEILEVREFAGEARGLEEQEVKWVKLCDLGEYQFPEANVAIVDKLKSR